MLNHSPSEELKTLRVGSMKGNSAFIFHVIYSAGGPAGNFLPLLL